MLIISLQEFYNQTPAPQIGEYTVMTIAGPRIRYFDGNSFENETTKIKMVINLNLSLINL